MTERVSRTVYGGDPARGHRSEIAQALSASAAPRSVLLTAAAALLLCTQFARTARAAEPWLRADVQRDACLTSADLQRETELLLARKPPAGVKVRAFVSDRGWTLELQHPDGQRARREFPVLPQDCRERVRALALATALAVEHAVEARPPSEEEAATAAEVPLRWALGVHAGASIGELSGPAPVLGAEARIERGMWVPLELLALADLRPAHASLAGAELATRQITGALGSCLGGRPGAWRVDGCLGVELGAVLGDAARLPQASRDTAGSGAMNLGLVTRWAARPRLALTARIEGFVRFWLPRFQVLDAEGSPFAAERLPLAGGRLRLGLSWLSP